MGIHNLIATRSGTTYDEQNANPAGQYQSSHNETLPDDLTHSKAILFVKRSLDLIIDGLNTFDSPVGFGA